MSEGKCTKDFPKSFLQLTEANNNGYPRYRRRDDGQTLVVGTHQVDNRWVVPYNPYLLVRFNAHINVEVCASVKSVKYHFEYVYKGHDRAEVEVTVGESALESKTHDEIKSFLDARYVSAPEAMWRMFEYRLHAHSHTICRLAFNLPNFQSVYFVEGSEEQALENASRRCTTLTAWFQLNCVDVSARTILYGDIPSAYVFRQNQWRARVRGGALCIGRMCSVNPKDSERYHLRLLLLHVAGAQSFEDLRTVEDIICSTFKEAAQRRELLADDSEWDSCLAEAAFEDFSCGTYDTAAEQMALRALDFQLRENRLSCHHYGPPAPLNPLLDSVENHLDVNEEIQIGSQMYTSLTPDQKSIVDTIFDSVNTNPRCFFIDGPGGTGKTYVYNTLIHCVRAVVKIVIPLASTGIAVTLLSGGQTVHFRFKLPIPLLENSVSSISVNSSEAERIRRSFLIIWDEAPMAHYRALEIVDRLLRDIMHCDLAFGGKVVVLGGDFRQVLPVVPRASRAEIVAACIKRSKLWPLFVILRLTQNMRAGHNSKNKFNTKQLLLTSPKCYEFRICHVAVKMLTSSEILPKSYPLVVDPPKDLVFNGPFTGISTALIKLYNASERRVAYKIKTTASNKYCVRPTCGFLDPAETSTITIMLQPSLFAPGDQNKHKFLIQSVFALNSQHTIDDIENLWRKARPSDFMEVRLHCIFNDEERVPEEHNQIENSDLQTELGEIQSEIASLKEERNFGKKRIFAIAVVLFALGLFFGFVATYLVKSITTSKH
ncbi:hypothetical protein LAZ67_19002143 [Cordylochernes scorpioides]|uniref:ATP-dependent DNA helicase n=1 Tax=Cordylochernes scorpioides TaxID=51811 RepID=A0ABY6LI85_9ARAC|nr:hypothetical protein LAZ67_19002143 [Cordylochernes scorpioides]